jgi:transposase InsO family protein
MRQLYMDNDLEFHSKSVREMCYSMGIEPHYAPRLEPWFKGMIERFFRTMNEGVAHGVPGTSFRNIFEKGGLRSSKARGHYPFDAEKCNAEMGRGRVSPKGSQLPTNDTRQDVDIEF